MILLKNHFFSNLGYGHIDMKNKKDKFIERANKKHDNMYNYSKVSYINNFTDVKIICSMHGLFKQTSQNHLRGESKLKKYRKNDKIKDDFAKNNGYNLIRIPYYKYNNIEKILLNNI
jgi:hypothetical protein